MAPRGVCGQLTVEVGFGRLSVIYQIIVNHQAIEATLQADWFYQYILLIYNILHTYIHTFIHTYIHTYFHMYIHSYQMYKHILYCNIYICIIEKHIFNEVSFMSYK